MKEIKVIELDDDILEYDFENNTKITNEQKEQYKELLDKLTNIERRFDKTERIIEIIESPMMSKEEISEKLKEFREKGVV